MNKNNSVVVTIVVIIIVAIGLYFAFRKPAVDTVPDDTINTPIVKTPVPVTTTKTYTDPSNTFSFSYPDELTVKAGDATKPWRTNTTVAGKQLASVTIPSSSQPNTNFSEAILSIGSSNNSLAVKNCSTAQNGESAKGEVMINGLKTAKITLSDAGAGNFYDTTSYRFVHNSQCYSVEYTIHSTNIANYTAGTKTEFNPQTAVVVLEKMVQSFSFAPSATIQTSFEGTWTGPEGTSLAIIKTGTAYTLSFVMLDGPIKVSGVESTNGITFTRKGKSLTLVHSSGIDTGMKYLVDKKNCVAVKITTALATEGYCKD
ncbi:MAG: hypothetical protein RL641_354 [Candidatus Parcubacteria bacterium]|jgi:hypothetical protein